MMGVILQRRGGFTLIELSTVLVIIGLIVGGVLVGQNLIHAATLRAEVSALTKYETAVNTFRVKYDALPGDMANATSLITGVTHNGNGDGMIDLISGGNYEYVYAWEHLSKAGLIEGSYDGNYAFLACPLTTCPQSKVNSADVFWIGGAHDFGTDTVLYGSAMTGTDALIAIFWATESNNNYASLSVADAQALDMKLDDGVADTGRFLTINDNGGWNMCVSGNYIQTDGAENYTLSHATPDCMPRYIMH
jgi:prepilin-type N-terminal cleavage/methylation domain-containing protein